MFSEDDEIEEGDDDKATPLPDILLNPNKEGETLNDQTKADLRSLKTTGTLPNGRSWPVKASFITRNISAS